jgi:hypothetical protein
LNESIHSPPPTDSGARAGLGTSTRGNPSGFVRHAPNAVRRIDEVGRSAKGKVWTEAATLGTH